MRAWRCLALPGCMDCSPPGSGRGGTDPLPPQYTDIQDGAVVPGMCEKRSHLRVAAVHETEEHTVPKYPFHGQ